MPVGGTGGSKRVPIIVLATCGVLVVLTVLLIVGLTILGSQVANEFSNVTNALPTPVSNSINR